MFFKGLRQHRWSKKKEKNNFQWERIEYHSFADKNQLEDKKKWKFIHPPSNTIFDERPLTRKRRRRFWNYTYTRCVCDGMLLIYRVIFYESCQNYRKRVTIRVKIWFKYLRIVKVYSYCVTYYLFIFFFWQRNPHVLTYIARFILWLYNSRSFSGLSEFWSPKRLHPIRIGLRKISDVGINIDI